MSNSPLRVISKEFAKQIVFLCREVKATHRESVLTNQLLRSGPSIGVNLHEAQYAQGTKDFISKLEIALKEANETSYWLKLMYSTNRIDDQAYIKSEKLCGNIRRLLIASCKTAKENTN